MASRSGFFTIFIKTDDLVAVTTFDFDNVSTMNGLGAFGIQPERKAERKVTLALRTRKIESEEIAETNPHIRMKEADDMISRKP